MSKFMKNLPVGIIEIDADGVVLQSNEMAAQLLPLHQSGDNLRLVISDLDTQTESGRAVKDRQSPWLRCFVKKAPLQNIICSIKGRDGDSRIWLMVYGEPIFSEKGDVQSAVLCVVNQTKQRQQMEKMKEQEAKLMEASRISAIGVMAGGLAHEINNPLAIIQGHVDIIAKKALDTEFESNIKNNIEVINKIVGRLHRITKDLLAFSGRSGSKGNETIQSVELINNVLDLCAEKAKEEGIEFVINEKSTQSLLTNNKAGLLQAMYHVIINAIQAAANSSEKKVNFDCFDERDHIVFAITDSGSGIPPEHAEEIFIPFFTTKEPGQGMGLGLSSAKGILKRCGAEIYLNLHSPRTQFVIRIPTKTTGLKPAA